MKSTSNLAKVGSKSQEGVTIKVYSRRGSRRVSVAIQTVPTVNNSRVNIPINSGEMGGMLNKLHLSLDYSNRFV